MPVEFVDGLRVTDDEAMEVVQDGARRQGEQGARRRDQRARAARGGHRRRRRRTSSAPRQDSPDLGRVGEVDDRRHDRRAATSSRTASCRSSRRWARATTAASYNINADLVAGELAAALGAEKVIFLTDVDGLYADFDDKSSLISALSLSTRPRRCCAERAGSAGMIPKVAGVRARARGAACDRAHILNGTVPHALLLEVYTDEGVGTMITRRCRAGRGGRVTSRWAPSTNRRPRSTRGYHMPTYARKPVMFVRGEGMRLYDDEAASTSTSSPAIGCVNLGHAIRRSPRRSPSRCAKLIHVSNLYYVEHRAELAERLSGARSAAAGRSFFCNSGAEAIEGAIKLARQWGKATRGETASDRHGRALLPRPDAGGARRHRPALEAGGVRAAAPGLHPRAAQRHRRARGGGRPTSTCAVMLEPIQGEGGVYPCDAEYLPRCARCATSGRSCSSSTRCRPASAAPARRSPSRATASPRTSWRLAKALANGLPVGAVLAPGGRRRRAQARRPRLDLRRRPGRSAPRRSPRRGAAGRAPRRERRGHGRLPRCGRSWRSPSAPARSPRCGARA